MRGPIIARPSFGPPDWNLTGNRRAAKAETQSPRESCEALFGDRVGCVLGYGKAGLRIYDTIYALLA